MSIKKFWYYYNDEDDGNGLPKDPLNTFSGSIVQFISSQNYPFQGLVVDIDPVQAGSGDPSPENVRPISGWTGVNVTRCGKNLFNGVVTNGRINNGVYTPSGSYRCSDYIRVKPYGTYTFCADGVAESAYVSQYTANKTFIKTDSVGFGTITLGQDTVFIRFHMSAVSYAATSNHALYEASEAAPHEAYSGDTVSVSWTDEAGTVYGGEVDVLTGKLTVTHVKYTITSSTVWSSTPSGITQYFKPSGMKSGTFNTDPLAMCDVLKKVNNGSSGPGIRIGVNDKSVYFYNLDQVDPSITDGSGTRQWLIDNSVSFTYPLATPAEYQLDPETIDTLVGLNNVWSDTGDTTVTVYGIPVTEPDADALTSLNILLGGTYNRSGDDPTDEEALDIILGGDTR